MRLYAPADPTTVLDGLLEEPSLARGVVHHAILPPRQAVYAPMPPWLDPRIVTGLAGRGIERLYSHQAEAIDAVHAGEDVVVVTPTASGKTLCYALPALQAIAEDSAARALFLFPTKALGQDQVTEFGELSASAGLSIITSTYDGDTPAPIRSAVRAAAGCAARWPAAAIGRGDPSSAAIIAAAAARNRIVDVIEGAPSS